MDVAQEGRENVDPGDETQTPEKTPMTEAVLNIEGGVDSRSRRRSKYLSSPYTNSGPSHKELPAEKEVSTPRTATKPKASTKKTTNPSNGASSFAKSGSKRFQNNWYKKFISSSSLSVSPKLINASSGDLLSGLRSIAVDCMFPVEDKNFDLVEWLICRYRISKFHDEAELAASLVNSNGGKNGKPVGNVICDAKSEKKGKNNKMENPGRYKRKYLSGLSDVKTIASTGGSKLKQKRKVEEVTSLHQPQNAETTLKESGNECSFIPAFPQNLSCLASEEKTGTKRRKKMEAAQAHASSQCTSNSTMSGRKLKQKRKVEQVTSLLHMRNAETNLIESTNKSVSVPEIPPNFSCLASQGKTKPRKRVNMKAAQEHQAAPVASHVDARNIKCSSLVIDFQITPPPIPVGIHEKNNGECTERLVFIGSNPEAHVSQDKLVGNVTNGNLLVSTGSKVGTASQEGLERNISNNNLLVNGASELGSVSQEGSVGNITNHNLLGGIASEVGIVSVSEMGPKNGKEKAPEKHHSSKRAIEIPDLNGTSFESSPTGKVFETANFLSIELNSDPRSLSACSRSVNFNRMEDDGESHGTCLILQFAPGVNIPSKEDLLTMFCRFGPLKASETQLIKDTAKAQIVFVRSTDAETALGSLELTKPFGEALVNFRLDHLPVAAPVKPVVTPVTLTQPNGSMSMPGDAPPSLHLMKKNLQLMTSMLENSGSNLSPQMRAKLDSEIKNLMRKVDSRGKV